MVAHTDIHYKLHLPGPFPVSPRRPPFTARPPTLYLSLALSIPAYLIKYVLRA